MTALETSLAYFEAWTNRDFDRALTHVADDVVCRTPAGRLDGAAALRGFMEPFSRIVTRSALVGAFGDEHAALVMYDTSTVPVPDAPGAEHHTVRDGRITEIRIVFDRLPFETARQG